MAGGSIQVPAQSLKVHQEETGSSSSKLIEYFSDGPINRSIIILFQIIDYGLRKSINQKI